LSKTFSPLALGVGFTAVLALVPGLGLGSKAPKPSAAQASKTAEVLKQGRKLEAVGALLDQCVKERPRAAESTVAVTILTLPDPHRTNMAFWFDLRLDAVQRAFKTFDFLPRTFYLPWEATGKEEGGSGISSDFLESSPGFIWFAREGPDPAYHALFIVGESQSLGVNREALRQALQLAARVPAPTARRVSILGPQFSGSLASLGAALEAHFKDASAPAVRIQGTTTLDADGSRILRQAIGPIDPRRLEISSWLCNLSGRSKEQLLNWYMTEAGWPRDASKVAVFTESNTVYSKVSRAGETVTQVLFPMGLSRLRSERRAMEQNLEKGGESKDLVLPSSLLAPT
jgi:hypothetical protein